MHPDRIIFDAEKLKNPYSGLGQFCFRLGNELAQLNLPDLCFYLPKDKQGIFGNNVEYMIQRGWHKFFGVRATASDILHSTHQTTKYRPSSTKTRVILTVHDLNFLHNRYRGLKKKHKLDELQSKVNRAERITAISQFAANELQEHIDLKGKNVSVIYNGNSLDKTLTPQKPLWIGNEPFLFTLGIILPRKNFHVLLPFIKELDGINLVVAGENTSQYAQSIRQQANQLGIASRLMLPGNITEAEKLWLYRHSEAFVFPSLAEGFGLPVVEAMSMGKPVFLNRSTSLPEIGGEKAFYWDHFDPKHMTGVYQRGMQQFREQDLSPVYIQHAAQFSWKNAAIQYAEIYNSMRQ